MNRDTTATVQFLHFSFDILERCMIVEVAKTAATLVPETGKKAAEERASLLQHTGFCCRRLDITK